LYNRLPGGNWKRFGQEQIVCPPLKRKRRSKPIRTVVAVGLALAIALSVAGYTSAGEEAVNPTPQTTCPVGGMAINTEAYADYQGKRVYFCCPGACEKEFMKDPERYIKEMEDQGITLEKAPEPGQEGEGA